MSDEQVAELLDHLLDPVLRSLTPESARRLLELRADPVAQDRMDELADRCNEGVLTAEERTEYEACLSAATLIGVLQARARATLFGGAAA